MTEHPTIQQGLISNLSREIALDPIKKKSTDLQPLQFKLKTLKNYEKSLSDAIKKLQKHSDQGGLEEKKVLGDLQEDLKSVSEYIPIYEGHIADLKELTAFIGKMGHFTSTVSKELKKPKPSLPTLEQLKASSDKQGIDKRVGKYLKKWRANPQLNQAFTAYKTECASLKEKVKECQGILNLSEGLIDSNQNREICTTENLLAVYQDNLQKIQEALNGLDRFDRGDNLTDLENHLGQIQQTLRGFIQERENIENAAKALIEESKKLRDSSDTTPKTKTKFGHFSRTPQPPPSKSENLDEKLKEFEALQSKRRLMDYSGGAFDALKEKFAEEKVHLELDSVVKL